MRPARILVAAGLGLALPGVAMAHLVVSGMGPVYDGVTHFCLSPEDGLPVLVVGLLAGVRGPVSARLLLGLLPLSWLTGSVAAMAGLGPAPAILAWSASALFIVIGGLLAANAPTPKAALVGVAGALGLSRGLSDMAGVTFDGAHFVTALGTAATVLVVFALAASLTLPLKRAWLLIATRVAGSWLAALGLLLAGWMIRFGAGVAS